MLLDKKHSENLAEGHENDMQNNREHGNKINEARERPSDRQSVRSLRVTDCQADRSRQQQIDIQKLKVQKAVPERIENDDRGELQKTVESHEPNDAVRINESRSAGSHQFWDAVDCGFSTGEGTGD